MNEINQVIKERRLELKLTMKQVADACGVSEATISRWESGEIDNMKRSRIASLANILKLSPSVIVGTYEDDSETKIHNAYYTRIHKRPQLARIIAELEPLNDSQLDGVEAYVTTLKQLK